MDYPKMPTKIRELSRSIYQHGKQIIDHAYNMSVHQMLGTDLSNNRFIVFGRGRSGSTALVSLLNNIHGIYCEGEILNKPVFFPYSHVIAKCSNSKASIYGCKILSYQIRDVQPIKNRESFISSLYDRGFKIIYLKRENLIYYALSNIRARKFGFHKSKSKFVKPKKTMIELNDLLDWVREGEELNNYESLLLEGIPHLALTYERHIATEASQQTSVKLVSTFLGIHYEEHEKVDCELQKISPRTLRDSITNYDEVIKFLEDTPYAKYLD